MTTLHEPRSWNPKELTGYRHELVWQPTRMKVGRWLFLAGLAVFAIILWRIPA